MRHQQPRFHSNASRKKLTLIHFLPALVVFFLAFFHTQAVLLGLLLTLGDFLLFQLSCMLLRLVFFLKTLLIARGYL